MQEFFDQVKIAGHSCDVCGQCNPENRDFLFEVKSFAQSIRGRLLEKAYKLELKEPDLRTYSPEKTERRLGASPRTPELNAFVFKASDREETLAKYIFRDTLTRDRYLQVRDDIEFI